MNSVAAAILVLTMSGAAATGTPATREGHGSGAQVSEASSFDLQRIGSVASAQDRRWRLRELAEPVAEETRSVVRWGWKKVTLRLPLGGTR
jgi:hypothetical protein